MPQPSVLLVHNFYQKPGGEDEVLRVETGMLRANGHDVQEFRLHNDAVDHMSKARLMKATLWNDQVYHDIQQKLTNIQVAHFHNTFPLISPAAYYAVRRRGVPVVQTLHNYRLLCPSAVFYRDGGVCEDCLGRSMSWPAVMHACYRGSRTATLAVAGMTAMHRMMGTWNNAVDLYIALTEFGRRKFIDGGIPARKIVVKPNCTEDPGEGAHDTSDVVFVGRLAPEKGIDTLIHAWHHIAARRPGVRLKIVGQGPMASLQSSSPPGVDWIGWQPHDELIRIMQRASLLVFPSVHYEGFPMTLVEAFATGLPVVASKIGAAAEIISDGQIGRLYKPGDADHLASILDELLAAPATIREMGRRARFEYEEKYTPQRNYDQLLAAYALATEYASAAVAS